MQIVGDGAVDDGGGIGFRAEGFVGCGEILQSVVHHPAAVGVPGDGQLGLAAVGGADGEQHHHGKSEQRQNDQNDHDTDGMHICENFHNGPPWSSRIFLDGFVYIPPYFITESLFHQ